MAGRSLVIHVLPSFDLIRFEFISDNKSVRWTMDYGLAKLIDKDDSYDYYDLSIEDEPSMWGSKNKIYSLSTPGLLIWFRPTKTGRGSLDFVIHEDDLDNYGFWIRKNDKFVSCYYEDEWANIDISYNYPARSKSARKLVN